jgi:hypothetical protein
VIRLALNMGVKQLNGGRAELWVLELADAGLEPVDVFPEKLGASLALAVVVFTSVAFLSTDALLACWS